MVNYNDIQKVLDKLEQLQADSSDETEKKTAKQWISFIKERQEFLAKTIHPIAFIGGVGAGKSSLISVATNLLTAPAPTDTASLIKNAILATGTGGVTLCETSIRVCKSEDEGTLGLLIEPASIEDMEEEIRTFAKHEWERAQPNRQSAGDTDSMAEELRRAIRAMTGYSEYQESYVENNLHKRRRIDPLDQIILEHNTDSSLADHLIEQARLAERNSPPSWWATDAVENRKALKERFSAINQGKDPATMLPRKLMLVVPQQLPVGDGLDLIVVDTRGLTPGGAIEARADLQTYLRNPYSIIVLCSRFADAPGTDIIALLNSMQKDAELREAISRVLLVVTDKDEAEYAPGADGDREFGQALRIGECFNRLNDAGIAGIQEEQIIAFNALRDDCGLFWQSIDSKLSALRNTAEKQLDEHIKLARQFLASTNVALRPEQLGAVDRRIKQAMTAHLPKGFPLNNPLQGLQQALRAERPRPAVIYATCRRRGVYERQGIDLYAAVTNTAQQAATAWLDDLIKAVMAELDKLDQEAAFSGVRDHISLRRTMFKNAQTILVRDYAHAVGTQVKNNLASDRAVWSACSDEWGKGLGFGDKVFSHFENWSKQHQQVFTAYEKTDAEELIPFWREAAQPVQAPQFTLHVRNLRAIRLSAWTPEPVSVLIGANGAGKTTLLKTLKLLHKAYESDLSKAVADVLGGSFNMRSWGVAEDDPVEIGLDFGTIQWRIQLTSKAGTVSKLASESLHENGLEVFNRDSLGNFVYGHERIESGRPIGLRTLMDRGSHEYAVRTVATLLQRIAVYADFDLCGLRDNGSNAFDDHVLNARGTNVLAVLRRWRDERTNQHRYEFVIDGLQAAFPYTFESLDFIAAGNTLQANIYSPHHESPSPLAHEANGFLQLLIALCAVAGTDAESVIAIDEPECGLHPYALSAFFRRTTRWAERYNVTVLLATHSLVLLDESRPEQVYVMKSPDPGGSMPVRLDQLYNPKWLAHFKMEEMEETEDDGYRLGDLYERGEVGSAGELRRQPLGPLKLGELYERGEIGSNKDAE